MPGVLDQQEYERRFLVTDATILEGANFQWIDQGYLWAREGYAIRVRLTEQNEEFDSDSDDPAIFTIKGPRHDATRFEQEFLLPHSVGLDLLRLSNFRITKKRYAVIYHQETWVVDVFTGGNDGLMIAEFEADSPQAVQAVRRPSWCGEEITDDRRYDNENLARTPYAEWKDTC